MAGKDPYIYFLYSEEQLRDRTKIDKVMSRVFTPGSVLVNGKRVPFTEISRKPKNRYADCKLVAEGYRSTMVYTDIR